MKECLQKEKCSPLFTLLLRFLRWVVGDPLAEEVCVRERVGNRELEVDDAHVQNAVQGVDFGAGRLRAGVTLVQPMTVGGEITYKNFENWEKIEL